jgi:hypothetical protein
MDVFTERCGELLTGSYECVDRIVLNGYFSMGHTPGGFRVWWRRWHGDSDEELYNAHLMRLAGRFSRRVRAFGKGHNVPVIDCTRDERKHRIAEDYLREHQVGTGVFLILVARAPATVWEVRRSKRGLIWTSPPTPSGSDGLSLPARLGHDPSSGLLVGSTPRADPQEGSNGWNLREVADRRQGGFVTVSGELRGRLQREPRGRSHSHMEGTTTMAGTG